VQWNYGLKNMSRYTKPDIGNNTLAYRGQRYWLIEFAQDGEFCHYDKSDCDYVLYDGEYDAVIAFVNDVDGGRYSGSIKSHVDLGVTEYSSLSDAVDGLVAKMETYLDETG